MTWFDIILIGIMFLSIAFAWFRGLSREISTLAALAIGFVTSIFLSEPITNMIGAKKVVLNLGVILVVFTIAFLVATALIDTILDKILGKTTGQIDRWLGSAFGFLRGYLLIGIGFMALDYYYTAETRPDTINDAATLGFAQSAAGFLSKIGVNNISTDSTPSSPTSGSKKEN